MLKENFWYNRQVLYLQVCRDSALILQRKNFMEKKNYADENDISRDLYFAIHEVVFSAKYNKQRLDVPTFQANAQPSVKDKIKVKREDKCPDFLWSYFDYVNRRRRDFHIECKRLRKEKNYHCREYVNNGLNRYLDKEWSYGLDCEKGLMIGYVEELAIEECIAEIEQNLTKMALPILQKLVMDINFVEVVFLYHVLDRTDIPITPFELHHYLIKIVNDKA